MQVNVDATVLCIILMCMKCLIYLIFTARAYARAVLGVVILSVCPSVCHTRGL